MRAPGTDMFIGEFYQKFNEEIILILYNLSQSLEAKGICPKSFYVVRITLILKPKAL